MLEIYQAIRDAVGPNTPLEIVYSVDEDSVGGYTVEDTIEFLQTGGRSDRHHPSAPGEMDPQHPLGFYH